MGWRGTESCLVRIIGLHKAVSPAYSRVMLLVTYSSSLYRNQSFLTHGTKCVGFFHIQYLELHIPSPGTMKMFLKRIVKCDFYFFGFDSKVPG